MKEILENKIMIAFSIIFISVMLVSANRSTNNVDLAKTHIEEIYVVQETNDLTPDEFTYKDR